MYQTRGTVLAQLSLCRMALGRLQILLFMNSNQFPVNFGLTAQNGPLEVATRFLGAKCSTQYG